VNPNMLLKSKETAITMRRTHKTCTIPIHYPDKTRKLKSSVQLVQRWETVGKRAKTEIHEQQPNWTAFQKGLYKPVDKSEIGRGMIKKNGVN